MKRLHAIIGLVVAGLLAPVALGQGQPQAPAFLKNVGIDQKLGAQVPADLVFHDETGKAVRLADYFGRGRPMVLSLVYYQCPGVCTVVLNDLLRSLKLLPLNIGRDFDVLTISFDPRETSTLAAAKKPSYVTQYERPGADAGWHFLTGPEESINRLTRAVGFRYVYEPASDQYVHASGVMVLTPEGRVSRYFYGIDYEPKDLRLSLVEASGGKIGTAADTLMLYCYRYDAVTGKYTLAVRGALRGAGAITVLLVGAYIWRAMRRDRRAQRPATGPAPGGGAQP